MNVRALTIAAAALSLIGAASAHAGEFVVTSCGESPTSETAGWVISSPTSTLDTGTQCPPVLAQPGPAGNASKHTGIYLTDKLATAVDTPGGASVVATFSAPVGTTITRARIWRYGVHFTDANWLIEGRTLEGQLLDTCTLVDQGCFFGNPNYAPSMSDAGDNTVGDFMNLSTAGVQYRLSCQAATGMTCSNGFSLYFASLSIFGTKLTVNDPSPPAQQSPSGPLWSASGFQSGTLALAAPSSDNTGIQTTRLSADGNPAGAAPRTCNYSQPVPCTTEHGAALSLNTSTLADGPHTIAVTAVDAASNESTVTRPAQLLTDNTAPGTPLSLDTPDGVTTRAENSWSLRWQLPADPGAAIVRARYTICPTGGGDCTSGQADGAGITTLPAFALPGPGTWDVRVFLEDALGHSDPGTAALSRLTYQPPGQQPTTPTSTTPPPTQTTTTPPPTTSTGTVPPPPPPIVKRSAALRVSKARRGRSSIAVTGTTSTLASGKVRVSFAQRVAGRTLRASRFVTLRRGRFALTLRLSGALARTSRGTLTVTYAGNARTKSGKLTRTLRRP